MPKTIASLIGSDEPIVAEAIVRLEQMTGYHGEDIHVLAEMEAAARRHIVVLGLDPNDTRGRELYYALIGRYHVDNGHLEDILGVKSGDSAIKRSKIATEFSSHARIPREVWVLKHVVAKELLRQHPPRKLMKLLNYRSVESLLKRGNINQIYALLPVVESPRWLGVFWKMHSKLDANQFETKKAEVIIVPTKIVSKLGAKGRVVSAVPQLGVVALWPTPLAQRLGVLGLSARILQATSGLRVTNTYLKFRQFQPCFGNLLANTWMTSIAPVAYFDRLPVQWRSLHAHYGKSPASQHPSALEPHIQAEDLFHQSTAQAIASIFSAGQWWARGEKLAVIYKSGPVSMNLIDVSANYAGNLSYRKRKFTSFQTTCMDEILHRYLAHQAVEDNLLAQLEATELGKPKKRFNVGSISINSHKSNTI